MGTPFGLFYGEQIFQFIQTSKTVTIDNQAGPASSTTDPTGPLFKVTSTDPLRLRSESLKDQNNPNSNVIASSLTARSCAPSQTKSSMVSWRLRRISKAGTSGVLPQPSF